MTVLLAFFGLLALPAYATTYTVTDTSDNPYDTGSIRYAVNSANAGSGGDTINITVLGTVSLINGALSVSKSVTITGPGAPLTTISGHRFMQVFQINPGATVTMSGLTIANGNAPDGVTGGGGILNEGVLSLNDCIITNNQSYSGGGITNLATLTITNSTISGNTSTGTTSASPGGGGILNAGAGTSSINNGNPGTLAIRNSTIVGNTAFTGAGISSDAGTLTASNITVTGNTASSIGGGISVSFSTATINGSIVAGNTTTANPGDDCDSCGTQSAYNMISTPGTILDPMLGPLQYNGGLTQTMMPLPGSPAIHAGLSSTLSTDQRGFGRNQGSGQVSDLGAVSTNYLTVTTTADTTSGNHCTGGVTCSLRDAINWTNSNDVDGDIIFASGVTGTITLGSSLPPFFSSINLVGPGASALTIDGAKQYSLFSFTGMIANVSGLTITNGLNNGAAGGGGIASDTTTLTLSNCVLSNNVITGSNGNGAGLLNSSGTAILNNCVIAGNFLNDGGSGGGVFNTGTMVIAESIVSNNTVGLAALGGGITNQGGTLDILNSTISGNSYGSGIVNNGTMTVTNSTITGNVSDPTAFGGGILHEGGTLDVISSTISGNEGSQTGGGIKVLSGAPISLSNSIVAGNKTDANPGDDCDGCGTQTRGDLISTSGTPITSAQLKLGPLALNGPNQTVPTLLPLPGSIAIQAGDINYLPVELATDQRGLPRSIGNVFDSGAVNTNYTDMQFVQQPTDTLLNALITPPVTLKVIESNAPALNVPVTLTFTGTGTQYGTLSGTLTETTLAPSGGGIAVATYSDLSVNALGMGDTLIASLVVAPAIAVRPLTITAPSNPFSVTAPAQSNPPGQPSYTMTANPTALSIAAGGTGSTTITFTPVGGYTGSLTLNCGTLPAFTKCAFTQGGTANSTVTMNGSNTPITVTLTISTNVATAMNVMPSILQTPTSRPATLLAATKTPTPMNPILPALAFWGPGGLAGLAAFGRKRKLTKKQFGFLQLGLLVLLTGALAAGLSGCGGSSGSTPATTTTNVTPAGTSAVVITAAPTSGTGQTLNLSVTITG